MIEVTPHDSNEIDGVPTVGVYVGVAGDVNVIDAAGNEVLLKNLAAGLWHPIGCTHVKSTDTTATDIRAGYYE